MSVLTKINICMEYFDKLSANDQRRCVREMFCELLRADSIRACDDEEGLRVYWESCGEHLGVERG